MDTIAAPKVEPFPFPEALRALQLERVSTHFDSFMKYVGTNVLGDGELQSTNLSYWTGACVTEARELSKLVAHPYPFGRPALAEDIPLYLTIAVEALVKHHNPEFAREHGYAEVKEQAVASAAVLAEKIFHNECAAVMRQYARLVAHFDAPAPAEDLSKCHIGGA